MYSKKKTILFLIFFKLNPWLTAHDGFDINLYIY